MMAQWCHSAKGRRGLKESSAARCLARRAKEARWSIATNVGVATPVLPTTRAKWELAWISVRPFGTLFEVNEGTSRRVITHAKTGTVNERPKFDETSKCPRNRQG